MIGEESLLHPDPFLGIDWRTAFGREAPIEVEIGFGKDTFLLDLAESRPEIDYLGVEYSRKRALSFLRKARERGLGNVRAMRVHAAIVLDRLLPSEGIRGIHVLFPDPWPKKRHHKNRLIQPPFARSAHRCLEMGGTVTLATDDMDYCEQMLDVMEAQGAFVNVFGRRAWVPVIPGHPKTIFEERWRRRAGYTLHALQKGAALDRLWRPWRMSYVSGPKPDGCVFCHALDAGQDEKHHVLHRGETCFVILNAYPYNTGHAMVLPNRHLVDMTEMTEEEDHEALAIMRRLVQSFRDAMNCEGVNIGLNLGDAAGGSIAHLHWHLVPRWAGDTNFMPVLSDSKVVVEMLDDTFRRLKPFIDAWSP